MPSPFISIICPVYNEEKYMSKCIDSMLQQDYPQTQMEMLFVDGMSRDKTRDIIQSFSKDYPFIKVLNNPAQIVPTALNVGIKAAKGEIIIRIDAHALYPNNYFSKLVEQLLALDAENVGGICNTIPAKNTAVCQAIACALSSSFGMGNSYFRIGAQKTMKVDTVPFGCFKKDLFDRIGLFDEDLVRNQDDEFNGRIIKNGGNIYLIPDLVITYYGRESLSKTSKMFYQYGLFKPLVNKKLGAPATLRQFFPALFLCGIIVGTLLSFLSKIIAIIFLLVLCLYFLIGLSVGCKNAISNHNFKIMFLLPLTFFLIHISYGFGYLTGIFKILFKQSFQAKVNR